ncbi:hypothetical protein N7492_007694 [Penicillium capsulatum]|uniref:GST N-terminal domain-containing protein n=1 Tax=Penicillium capsulatum TaxID=69766 RepID=A0A9W9LL36_9EURO|nr:hypothetical protein N7492_007694 [Penicillium capsulatum]KAJ6117527.1 hypothetical protein N7512_007252 [Penicillium capsulatum]
MSDKPIHLFDITSTFTGPAKSWSPNTLKVRAVLNFKKIPYTQSWVSYPDIAPLLKSLDVPPNAEGKPYTLPAIVHKASISTNAHGAMMDSFPIIQHLETLYPSPPLFPSGDASYALLLAIGKIASVMAPAFRQLIIPRVPEGLDPRGAEYFIRTRTEAFGKPLADVRPKDREAIEALWADVEREAGALLDIYKGREGKKGPFVEGETPGYTDLVLATQIAFFERYDWEFFERFVALGDGQFRALYEACLPWVEGQGEEIEWPIPQ